MIPLLKILLALERERLSPGYVSVLQEIDRAWVGRGFVVTQYRASPYISMTFKRTDLSFEFPPERAKIFSLQDATSSNNVFPSAG